MKKVVKVSPKIIIEVVYKSKDNTWRGFCAPFDISCTANTMEKAKNQIDELVNVYMDGLKKYGFPSHLTIKELSDEEDKLVFEKVIKHVSKEIAIKMRDNFKKFQLKNTDNQFRMTDKIKATGTYSFLPAYA